MKYIAALFLFLGLCGVARAGTDSFGNVRLNVARSSLTRTAEPAAFLSSSTIFLYGVLVTSATANSWIDFNDDSGTANVVLATAATVQTIANGWFPFSNGGIALTDGLKYSKFGTATIMFFWDYYIPRPVQ